MTDQLPAGWRFDDEPAPTAATAPTLPPGFRFADEPAPDVPLPPRRPDDINALPDNPPPANPPMPSPRPAEFGSSYDDAGQFPSAPGPGSLSQPAHGGWVFDQGAGVASALGGSGGRISPEQGQIEHDAKVAAARDAYVKARQEAADAHANIDAVNAANATGSTPTFDSGAGSPPLSGEDLAALAEQRHTAAADALVALTRQPNPTITPGRQAAEAAVNAAGKTVTSVAGLAGKVDRDLWGHTWLSEKVKGANESIDSAFAGDAGRSDELGTKVASAIGGMAPLLPLAAWSPVVAAGFAGAQGANSAYESTEATQDDKRRPRVDLTDAERENLSLATAAKYPNASPAERQARFTADATSLLRRKQFDAEQNEATDEKQGVRGTQLTPQDYADIRERVQKQNPKASENQLGDLMFKSARDLEHSKELTNRWLSALGGGAIGTAQMLPFSRLIGRMEAMAPGSIVGTVKNAAEQGIHTSVEQVVVQGLSQIGDNGIKKLFADKDQSLIEGVAESAQIAAIVGGALGIGGVAFNSATARQGLAKSTPEEIDAFVNKTGTRTRGEEWRSEIDDFLRQQAAKEAQSAPSPESEPAPASKPAAAPGDTTGQSEGIASPPNGRATAQPGDATLKALGWGDEEIGLMGPGQRATELEKAAQEGVNVPDEPTGAAGERGLGAATPAASEKSPDTAESGTRAAPVKVDQGADLDAARSKVDPHPTQAQIEAGNYSKGHVTFDGLPISIENPKGSVRSGTDPDGKPWQATLPADYGYIKGSKGADGDHVDAFIGDKPPNGRAFVIDQHDPATGKFDEHKVILGVDSAGEAARLYTQAFSDGKGTKRIGGITEVPTAHLKTWLASGEQKGPIGAPAETIQLPNGFKLANDTAGDAAAPQPKIVAHHGTKANVDHFNDQYIGTGEGVQAFGRGHYFAENEGVARSYAEKLAGKGKGNVYRVEIAAHPDKFIDWDASMRDQPAVVQKMLGWIKRTAERDPENASIARYLKNAPNMTGKDLVMLLHTRLGHDERTTARTLQQVHGIEGIRYLDGSSRKRGDGSHNYVVFDQDKIEITHKNGDPIAKPETPVNEPAPADTAGDTTLPANEPAANQEQQTGTSPSKPSKAEKPRAPQTLLSFIRAAGGIKDVGGNLRAAGLHRYPGLINNKKGMDPDRAREAAAEAGYLGADRDHAHSNTTPDDLTNALLNHPTYSTFDEEQLHQWKAAKGISEQREKDYTGALDAIHADQVENGVLSHQVDDEYLHEAARLHVDEGVPIGDAYERAVMNDLRNEAESDQLYEADPSIPWDNYETTAEAPRTEASPPPSLEGGRHGEERPDTTEEGRVPKDREGPANGSDSERKPAEESLDGVEVDAATKVKGGLHDGEFTVVARRQKPFSAERGFGKTPAEARADALRRLGITEKPTEEAGAEGKPQLVIPGAEKIGDGDLAQIKADESLKPKAPQKDTDGLSLFNDSSKQTDLLDMPPAAKPDVRQRIEDAYLDATGGKYGEMVGLDKIRAKLSDLDRATVDAALKKILASEGETATLQRNDDPRRITPEQKEAAFSPAGEPFHSIAISKKPLQNITENITSAAPAGQTTSPFAKMAQDIADEFGMSKGEHEANTHFLSKDEPDGSRSFVKVRGTSKGVLVTAFKGHMEGRIKSGVARNSDLLTTIEDVRKEVQGGVTRLGFNALSPLGKRVLDEMVNIAGYGARGYIADIRHAMPDVPRAELDKALLEIHTHDESNAHLMHMDNPRDKRAAEANAGAVDFKGEPKQLFWVNEPKGKPLTDVVDEYDAKIDELIKNIVEAPPAGQKTASPFDPSKGVPDAVADHLYRGEAFADIRAARKFVKENGGEGLNPKQMEEAIEHGVVKAARAIVTESKTPAETYDRLVALYANQPKLATRTSTSVEQQAYSTPAPLAYIASRLARASEGWVLEPTAGNGMLLIEVDPKLQSTTTNEINPDRAAALKEQGFKPTKVDASDHGQFSSGVADVVLANPPFGVVKEGDKSKRFDLGDIQKGYRTNEIDHVIALRALAAMNDNGRAVLILGGINKLVKGNEKRSDAYHGKAKREFFHVLYNRYNVTDHFTVAGELYEKQGAGYPIDVIAISGRGKSARKLPSVDVPPVLRSWDELKEKLNVAPDRSPRGEDNNAPGLASQRPEPAGPRALDAEHPSNDGGVGHSTGNPAERPEGIRSGRGSGQSGDPGTAGESRPEVRSDGERNAGPASELSPTGRDDGVKAQAPARQEQETEGQAAYRPKSEKIRGLGTLVPKNMRRATEEALAKVAKKQSVEEYVAAKLGMKPDFKGPDGKEYFAAEQIDALALAIHNLEKGSGFIIGDQTGIGKGRVNAAIIRYAIQKKLTPIFVTEKPNLYADMYRDLTDIGIQNYLGREPNILATDSNFRLPLDEDGKIILKTADAKTHGQLLSDVGSKGTLSDHDMVFTTYSQMQTVKGAVTRRQTALRGLAPRAILVLDESHNAGGNTAANANPDPNKPSRSVFARDLVNAAQGVFYSSATYAKRPDVMDLYSKTDMAKAVDNPADLPEAMATGGIPMQQVVASMLAEAGQYIRRERSFAGVTYDAKTVPVKRDVYNNFSKSISKIHEFSETTKGAIRNIGDKVKEDAQHITPDGSTGGAGVVSTNFTSIMHNLVSQLLLAMKVKPAVEIALEALKQGEKPVLTVANTMESFLSEYAERLGINPGDPIAISFSDLLQRYLDRTRTITIKKPFSKEKGERHYLTDEELGPAGVAAYKRAQKEIGSHDFGALPLSPLDYMKDELTRAGYKVAEITGRKSGISYADTDTTTGNSPKAPRYYLRSQKSTSIAGRRQAIKDFNGGNADVMILNQAGATGLSIHAGEKFKDQRRRHMMLVQPEANVDTHMQMLGRVHRTGQVIEPKYSQLLADIPAEKRPGAVLAKKMASLNASTTAARDGALTAKTVVDFMNQYGDEVATNLMAENPALNIRLGVPVDSTATTAADRDGAIRTLTGRIPLLPIEMQEEVYDQLESDYKSLLEEKEAAGENGLEAKRLDLDARPISSLVVREGSGDNPFTQPVKLETLDVKRQSKPYTAANLLEDAAKSVELTPHDDPSTALKQIEDAGRKQSALQAKAARDAFKTFSKELLADIENEQTLINSRARLDDIEKRYTDLMDVARVGNQVSVLNDDQRFTGVITKVYREGKAQNPLALGSWKIKLAIPGQGNLPLPFSKLYTSAKPAGREDETFYRLEASLPDSNLLNHFDEMSKEGREQRIMLTGNLLAAYAFKKGQIVHFTDHTGDVRQGVLLPGSVKTADDVMAGKGVPLKGGQAVLDELKARPDGVLTAVSDAALVLLRDPRTGTLTISVASSKAKGGHYFLDRELRTIAEADFIKFGPTMRLTIPTSGNQLGAIDRLLAKGAKFEKKGANPPTAAGRVGRVEADPRITPEMEKAVDDALMAAGIARRIAGQHADVKITLNKIETPAELRRASGDENSNIVGLFDSETKRLLIRAATGEEKRTAFHEAFHALDSADAFQPHERAVMDRELPAMRDKVAKVYDISPENLRHMPDHEIRAYAFEEYADRIEREEPNVGSGIHIGLRRIFDKVISFLRKLRNMLEGHGFQNKDDVFERARKGEVGDRQAGPRAGSFQNGPTSAAKVIKPKVRDYFDNEPFLDRVKRKIRDGIDPTAMKEGWLDLSARVEKMQRELQAQGNTIGPGQDVYKAKRLLPGKTAARSIDFDRDYVKPLAAEAKAAGLTRQDVAKYMFARHAPERNARMDQIDPNNKGRGSGITDAEAQKILNRLGRDGKLAALQKIEPRIDAIREFELKTLLNAGAISPEQYDAVRDQYQHYAPLRGWEDPDLVPEGTYRQTGGGKLQVKGREWQQAFGRKSVSDDPLANLISQAHRAIERAERNNVGATMWRLLKSLPKADLEAIAQLDKGHQTKVLDETTGQVRYVEEPGWRHREDAFAFKIGGKPHYIVFHDPKLAQGLNRLHPDQLPTWLRPVAAFINLEKSLWTHYSPDFVFRHFFMRYPAEAFGNASEDGIGAMFRTLKGYPGGPAFQALIKADRMNAIERADLAQKFATGKATKGERLQHYYHEMRAAGGLMKFADIAGPERIKNKLDAALARLDKNPVKATIAMMRTAHEAVDHMTNALDNAQRLAVYAEARDKGATPSDAAMKAREATIDFALKGTHQKLINIMWPFGNTAGQTASRSVRALGRSSNYRKMVLGLMALGAAQALYNILYGGNDPKDGKPYFEKIADYTRRLNFVFMTPLKDADGRPYAMTWSLPYFFSLPFTAGSAVMQLALKAAGIAKEPAGAILTNVMHSALEALTPVSQEETLIGKVTPEPFRGLLHAYLNKNFAGYALYTEHPRAGLARSEQGRPNTPDVWKSIASGANKLTGGSRYEGGALDFYPEAWREVIGNPTSTMERLFKHTHDAIDDIAHGRNPNIDDVPIARTMARGDKAYDQADRSSYYEERNKAFAAEAAYKKAASEGDSAAAQRIAKESGHDIALAKLFHQSQGLIANIYKQRDAIDRAKSLSSDEKEKRKRDLNDRELKIMNQVRQTAEQTAAH